MKEIAMLDLFIEAAYAHEVEKKASAAELEKLRTFPVDVLQKLASGEVKLAYGGMPMGCSSDGSGIKSWLDGYRGSPLFDQALELERSELQLEQQDQERSRAQSTESNQSWQMRDAIRLKKRLLDLDLVLQEEGGGAPAAGAEAEPAAPEQKEEKGVELLEQAQAEETVAGEGDEPHEQAEDAAISQFRKAQAQEAEAKAKKPPAANGIEEEEEAAVPPPKQPAAPPKAEVKVAADSFETVSKQASAAVDTAVNAGKFMAKLAKSTAQLEEEKAHHELPSNLGGLAGGILAIKPAMRSSMKAMAGHHGISGALRGAAAGGATELAGTGAGRWLGSQMQNKSKGDSIERQLTAKDVAKEMKSKTAAENPEGHHIRRALLGNPISTAIEAKSGKKLESGGRALGHQVVEGLKGTVKGGLGGAGVGGALGAAVGALKGGKAGALKGLGAGALGGGILGANVGSTYGTIKGNHDTEASRIHGENSKHKEASVGSALKRGKELVTGSKLKELNKIRPKSAKPLAELLNNVASEKAKVGLTRGVAAGVAGTGAGIGAISAMSGKKKEAGIGQVASGLVGAAKGAGSMLSTAYKSGGLGQVAKSVGSVAGGFAKANPLAAAGAAAGAGVLAGRLSKGNPQQRV